MGLAMVPCNCAPAQQATDASHNGSQVLRVIQDPGAHAVWLLRADPLHPAGPGMLVECKASDGSREAHSRQSAAGRSAQLPLGGPLIRAGAHLLIEQHSAHLDSWLNAVALEPAYAGMSFHLRLAGGQVLRAIAIDAHTARLVAQSTITDFGSGR